LNIFLGNFGGLKMRKVPKNVHEKCDLNQNNHLKMLKNRKYFAFGEITILAFRKFFAENIICKFI
jgi:hypothetical protein